MSTGPVGPLPPGSPEENKKEKKEKTSKAAAVAKERIKSHEAEDAGIARHIIMRQASESNLRHMAPISEKEDIASKSGALWECIERRPAKSGGYIYKFKLRPEYNSIDYADAAERDEAAEKKEAEIFPAAEPMAEDIFGIIGDEYHDQYQQLGYKFEHVETGSDKGFYMHLPDKEALAAKWEEFRTNNREIFQDNPFPFDILSSEGIASDIDYAEAFLTHDVLLSTEKEFVHDHFAHVILTLREIFKSPDNYQNDRFRLARLINKGYRTIMIAERVVNDGIVKMSSEQTALITEHLDKMKKALGIFVDLLTARGGFNEINEETLRRHFYEIWNEFSPFDAFWKRELGKDYPAVAKILPDVWTQIKQIEKKFTEKYTEKVALVASQVLFTLQQLHQGTSLKIVNLHYISDENRLIVVSQSKRGPAFQDEIFLKFSFEPGNERVLRRCLELMMSEFGMTF